MEQTYSYNLMCLYATAYGKYILECIDAGKPPMLFREWFDELNKK